jgi:hypothetical protein
MLHAFRLAFAHPVTGAPITAESPLPEDFRRALATLRRGRPKPTTRPVGPGGQGQKGRPGGQGRTGGPGGQRHQRLTGGPGGEAPRNKGSRKGPGRDAGQS